MHLPACLLGKSILYHLKRHCHGCPSLHQAAGLPKAGLARELVTLLQSLDLEVQPGSRASVIGVWHLQGHDVQQVGLVAPCLTVPPATARVACTHNRTATIIKACPQGHVPHVAW